MKFDVRKLIIPAVLILILIGAILGIVRYQSARSTDLIINTNPSGNVATSQSKINIEGTTNNFQNIVTINGEKVDVQKDGSFQKEVTLKDGENEITIQATAFDGRSQTKKIVVTKTAPGSPQEKQQAPIAVPNQPQETQPASPETQSQEMPQEEQSELAASGPRENAILFFTILTISYIYWRKSRKKLKA
ncbi:MAG: hypothetical protein M1355_00495 [Patescibacteria group bacterium]|nr:hypothetical protein [Patescibacteria group bacterium]